jgi:uncharacterized protein YdhG (YjbR/CyaY superfamily)
MSPPAQTVDEYLAALPEEQRAALQSLRETIRSTVPEASEAIAYGMAGYKYKKKPLIYLGAAKNHCGIYGARPEALEEDLKSYDVSKGTIRFSPDSPIPKALVKKLLKARIAEIEAGAGGYAKATKRKNA